MPVGSDLEIHAQWARGAFEARLHAPFTRLDPNQALRAKAADRGGQFSVEVACVRIVIELPVMHGHASPTQRVPAVTHRG